MQVAAKLKLQCLLEVHTVAELERVLQLDLSPDQCMLGINNRDLQTFLVDLNNNKVIMESQAGKKALDRGFIFAGESGIFTPAHLHFVQVCQQFILTPAFGCLSHLCNTLISFQLLLQSVGCAAVLVGESLIREADHRKAVEDLLSDI